VPPEELAYWVQRLGGPVPNINVRPAYAWKTVRQLAGPWDLICVTGSFFLAAEMRELVLADPFPTAVFQRQPAPPLSVTV
jgi:dihydrofolate synthase/folylpolyglutamate synthase